MSNDPLVMYYVRVPLMLQFPLHGKLLELLRHYSVGREGGREREREGDGGGRERGRRGRREEGKRERGRERGKERE